MTDHRNGPPAPRAARPASPPTAKGERALGGLPVPGTDGILVCPLGGVDEIGMNWTLYGFAGKWVLVDAGSSFAPRDVQKVQGVEAIIPDPRILRTLGKSLVGLIVTHFHEDHVGAIHRLWPSLVNCPIHLTPFAHAMLSNRLRERGTLGRTNFRIFKPGDAMQVGPFAVRSLPVGHSTPESVALALRCTGGLVLHTGDWKLDPRPGIGLPTDLARFREVARQGVDLMLCDSTNSDRERPASSEATVQAAFAKVFAEAKGMVVVCSFGSNVARMASVAHAAAATRRRVAIAGSSLRRAHEAADGLGMLKGVPRFLDRPRRLDEVDRRQQVLMCTGTQGEENAALNKLSLGHPSLPRIRPGDVIVHSARCIPGNEDHLYPVLSRLEAMGARIVTPDNWTGPDPVHVTGHPSRPELRTMYEVVLPRCAIPVHGTAHHLETHAELARASGVERVEVPRNGTVFKLREGALHRLGRLEQRLVAVLGDERGTMVRWDPQAREAMLGEVVHEPAHVIPPRRGPQRAPQDARGPREAPRRPERDERRGRQSRPQSEAHEPAPSPRGP